MDSSWLMTISAVYLIGLVLIRAVEVLQLDIRKLKGKERRYKHPPEDNRVISLLAQYLLPVSNSPRRRTWWQVLLDGLAWLEPLAVVYFGFVAVRYDEARPLLIVLAALAFLLLNNVWRANDFSLRKKMRLTSLLPIQLIPYYALSLMYTLKDIYRLSVSIVRAFSTRQINFPFKS